MPFRETPMSQFARRKYLDETNPDSEEREEYGFMQFNPEIRKLYEFVNGRPAIGSIYIFKISELNQEKSLRNLTLRLFHCR